MTAKEDKKTPARVGRVPGLILAQRWGRPSLAGGVLPYFPAARQRAEVARKLEVETSIFKTEELQRYFPWPYTGFRAENLFRNIEWDIIS